MTAESPSFPGLGRLLLVFLDPPPPGRARRTNRSVALLGRCFFSSSKTYVKFSQYKEHSSLPSALPNVLSGLYFMSDKGTGRGEKSSICWSVSLSRYLFQDSGSEPGPVPVGAETPACLHTSSGKLSLSGARTFCGIGFSVISLQNKEAKQRARHCLSSRSRASQFGDTQQAARSSRSPSKAATRWDDDNGSNITAAAARAVRRLVLLSMPVPFKKEMLLLPTGGARAQTRTAGRKGRWRERGRGKNFHSALLQSA